MCGRKHRGTQSEPRVSRRDVGRLYPGCIRAVFGLLLAPSCPCPSLVTQGPPQCVCACLSQDEFQREGVWGLAGQTVVGVSSLPVCLASLGPLLQCVRRGEPSATRIGRKWLLWLLPGPGPLVLMAPYISKYQPGDRLELFNLGPHLSPASVGLKGCEIYI